MEAVNAAVGLLLIDSADNCTGWERFARISVGLSITVIAGLRAMIGLVEALL